MAGWSLPYAARLARSRVDEPVRDRRDAEVVRASAATSAREPTLRDLFDAHYAAIWRLLRRLGVEPSQLDDAAQEVFWVAARRLADIERGREHSFLYGVALRIASNEHRRRKHLAEPIDLDQLELVADGAPSPEEQLDERRARALLDVVLDRMPIDLRTVFVLCELEELEVREVALLEGVPLGTASSRLRRAREEFSAIAKRVRATLSARGGVR